MEVGLVGLWPSGIHRASAGLVISRKQDTELPTANHPQNSLRGCPRVAEHDTTGKVCVVISRYMDDMQQGLVVVVPPARV